MTEKTIFIHTYTRKQALEDGVLVDFTDEAQSAGIRVPTAFTAAAWAFVTMSPWDFDALERADAACLALDTLVSTVRSRRDNTTDTVYFDVSRWDENRTTIVKRLKAVVGPDDDGRTCLTVMLGDED